MVYHISLYSMCCKEHYSFTGMARHVASQYYHQFASWFSCRPGVSITFYYSSITAGGTGMKAKVMVYSVTLTMLGKVPDACTAELALSSVVRVLFCIAWDLLYYIFMWKILNRYPYYMYIGGGRCGRLTGLHTGTRNITIIDADALMQIVRSCRHCIICHLSFVTLSRLGVVYIEENWREVISV